MYLVMPKIKIFRSYSLMSKVFDEVEILTQKYSNMWTNIVPNISCLRKYSSIEKKKIKTQVKQSINVLIAQLKNVPNENKTNVEWQNDLKSVLRHRAKLFLKIDNKDFEDIMMTKFTDTTEAYIDSAKEFDEDCTLNDIMQAMRNVWIMNMIQAIANIEIRHTPSIFAYSMLYPCTDNLLDDPQISKEEKKKFNQKLGKRLEGQQVEPASQREKQIYDLIGMIEDEYPRDKYPQVFDSVISIHKGQCKSLTQQDLQKNPKAEDILDVSIEKGGTSVLADAYLVCGDLDSELSDLMFGFGFVLQLIDDLQDAKEDFENNHSTIFSMQVKKQKFDYLTDKLITFIFTGIDYESYDKSPYIKDIKNLIFNNTLLLVFESIWENRKLYSKSYIRKFRTYSPVDFGFVKRNMRQVRKNLKEAEQFF